MKSDLAVFTGSPDAMARWQALPETKRRQRQAQGVAGWTKWASDNAAAIVEMGGRSVAPSWYPLRESPTFATTSPRSPSCGRNLRRLPRRCF